VHSLPVERLVTALLQILRYQGPQNIYLTHPLLKIIFTLSSIDPTLGLNVLNPVFEDYFFPLAVECQTESIRESAWNCVLSFFTTACERAFPVTNGNEEHSDSDNENRMDTDRKPTEWRDMVLFLWDVAMESMRRARNYIPTSSKAFETGANMLRYFLILHYLYQDILQSCGCCAT
jgi:hypothetical protein